MENTMPPQNGVALMITKDAPTVMGLESSLTEKKDKRNVASSKNPNIIESCPQQPHRDRAVTVLQSFARVCLARERIRALKAERDPENVFEHSTGYDTASSIGDNEAEMQDATSKSFPANRENNTEDPTKSSSRPPATILVPPALRARAPRVALKEQGRKEQLQEGPSQIVPIVTLNQEDSDTNSQIEIIISPANEQERHYASFILQRFMRSMLLDPEPDGGLDSQSVPRDMASSPAPMLPEGAEQGDSNPRILGGRWTSTGCESDDHSDALQNDTPPATSPVNSPSPTNFEEYFRTHQHDLKIRLENSRSIITPPQHSEASSFSFSSGEDDDDDDELHHLLHESVTKLQTKIRIVLAKNSVGNLAEPTFCDSSTPSKEAVKLYVQGKHCLVSILPRLTFLTLFVCLSMALHNHPTTRVLLNKGREPPTLFVEIHRSKLTRRTYWQDSYAHVDLEYI